MPGHDALEASRNPDPLDEQITVREAVAYLHRVGLHDAADRMEGEPGIVVLRPRRPVVIHQSWCAIADPGQSCNCEPDLRDV